MCSSNGFQQPQPRQLQIQIVFWHQTWKDGRQRAFEILFGVPESIYFWTFAVFIYQTYNFRFTPKMHTRKLSQYASAAMDASLDVVADAIDRETACNILVSAGGGLLVHTTYNVTNLS